MLPIYSRTPVATAQQAATIDEYSGGRMVLGLGVSHKVTVENWYGAKIEQPVSDDARVRRRRAGDVRRRGSARRARSSRRNFRFMGFEPRADLPIYVAGLSPKMLQLAGEIADGVMLWLCNPEYIRDVVVPEVRAGRERAGKSLEGFDIVAAVPAAVTDDRAAAYETMRADLVTYWSLPFYRAMIERSGFGEDIAAFDAGHEGGRRRARPSDGISDRFLEALTAIGSPDEDVAPASTRYRDAGATSPCVGAVPGTDFDADAGGRGAVAAAADCELRSCGHLLPICGAATTLEYVTDGVTDSQHPGEAPRAMEGAPGNHRLHRLRVPHFRGRTEHLEGHRPPGG